MPVQILELCGNFKTFLKTKSLELLLFLVQLLWSFWLSLVLKADTLGPCWTLFGFGWASSLWHLSQVPIALEDSKSLPAVSFPKLSKTKQNELPRLRESMKKSQMVWSCILARVNWQWAWSSPLVLCFLLSSTFLDCSQSTSSFHSPKTPIKFSTPKLKNCSVQTKIKQIPVSIWHFPVFNCTSKKVEWSNRSLRVHWKTGTNENDSISDKWKNSRFLQLSYKQLSSLRQWLLPTFVSPSDQNCKHKTSTEFPTANLDLYLPSYCDKCCTITPLQQHC